MQLSRDSKSGSAPAKTTNPFLSDNKNKNNSNSNSNSSSNSNSNSSNIFFTARSGAEQPREDEDKDKEKERDKEKEKERDKERDKEKEKGEEFPSLLSRGRAPGPNTTVTAATAATAAKASYKELLVSRMDHRMLEAQAKMRSAQAAELERSSKYYSNAMVAAERAERAVRAYAGAALAATATELEMTYDEDGRERS